MNIKLVYLIPIVIFGLWWRLYLLSGNDPASNGRIDASETLNPQEPLLKATGCGIGPRAVRVNLGDLAGFAGDPSILAHQLARRRLANEVRCNKPTQLFSVQWNMVSGSSQVEEQYEYNRKAKTLSHARSWMMMSVPREKPRREIYRNVSDSFVYKGRF